MLVSNVVSSASVFKPVNGKPKSSNSGGLNSRRRRITNHSFYHLRPTTDIWQVGINGDTVKQIQAKSHVPISLLGIFRHVDHGKAETLLAFSTPVDRKTEKTKIGIHIFNNDAKLVGQIVARINESAAEIDNDTKNPFVRAGQKYAYIETVDNFGNTRKNIPISWEEPICEDKVTSLYKGIGRRLYELLAARMSELRLDDNKGFACLARIVSGSTKFHAKLGFESYGYTLDRVFQGDDVPYFEGMYTPEAVFNELKKAGRRLLKK